MLDEFAEPSAGEYSADEVKQVINLKQKLDTIPGLHLRREQLYRISPKANSQMAFDNAATNPTELGHLVTYCQNMAIDNLRSLRLLLIPSDNQGVFLPQSAMYPLIRTVIESSAQALWLLEAEESRERITRTLRARRSEIKYEYELVMMMNGEDSGDSLEVRKSKARAHQLVARNKKLWHDDLKKIAGRNSIKPEEFEMGMPGYGSIIQEAARTTPMLPELARATWQHVSGFTHPSSTRGIGFSRVEELVGSTAELRKTRMTADPRTVNAGLTTGLMFYGSAENLLGTRLITPSGLR